MTTKEKILEFIENIPLEKWKKGSFSINNLTINLFGQQGQNGPHAEIYGDKENTYRSPKITQLVDELEKIEKQQLENTKEETLKEIYNKLTNHSTT